MKASGSPLASTFRSLGNRNFRLYFAAQLISVSGTWMQTVAQAWLVLRIAPRSSAGVDLGLVTALQFLPMLLFGTWGGLVADRLDKRHVLYATQSSAGVLALVLGLLTQFGSVRLWEVYLLASLLGFVNLFDNPARQTFVLEMVGRDDLTNAVSLNSILMNGARVIGPAVGGVLIASVGLAVCFEANAASYLAVIVALALMHKNDLFRSEPVARAKHQLRDGLRYAWETPIIRDVLLLVGVVGTLAYNFQVVLALFAKETFHHGASTYSALTAVMGIGAVAGGLVAAARNRPNVHRLASAGLAFGGLILALALSPSLPFALVVIFPMGAASIWFISTANSTLQIRADPSMRGRVMALYAIGFLGSTPIGGPLVGWISQVASPRVALAVGGGGTVLASLATYLRHRRYHRETDEARSGDFSEPGVELGID
jgi:MFS family permease